MSEIIIWYAKACALMRSKEWGLGINDLPKSRNVDKNNMKIK